MDQQLRLITDGALAVPTVGRVVPSGRNVPPWVLLDPLDDEVEPACRYLRELTLSDMSTGTVRAYAYGLLRWFRLLWFIDHAWDTATRSELEALVGALKNGVNPQRLRKTGPPAGSTNPKTGKRIPGPGYSANGINHTLSVISGFYEYHSENGRGPVVNPVPVNRARLAALRHRSPIDERPSFSRGPLRQKVPRLEPRAIPDDLWDEFLAAMTCDRDRALLLMFVTSGARAQELLDVTLDDIDWAGQKFYVTSKGTRAREAVPASQEALRALSRYLEHAGPLEPSKPLWRTRRGSSRPLTYAALRRIIQRANEKLGTNWTAHDLRHTMAMRLAADPAFQIHETQRILRHANLATTGIYHRPRVDDLIDQLQEHYERPPVTQKLTAGYSESDLEAVFGGR